MNVRRQSVRLEAAPARAWMARLGRLWRAFATGLCFVFAGVIGWLAGVLVLPVLLVWPGAIATRQHRIQRFVGGLFRALVAMITRLGVGRTVVEGEHWLDEAHGKLLVANHPMYMDAPTLLAHIPEAACVVKQSMCRKRWARRLIKAVGFIGNDDEGNPLDDCVAALKQGRPLLVFPEGTRSTPGQPLAFQRGAAQVAARSGCDIMPVVISCEPRVLGKGQPWYAVAAQPWTLHLRICPPQTLADLGAHDGMPHGVAARRVNRALEAFFAQELAANGRRESVTEQPPAPRVNARV